MKIPIVGIVVCLISMAFVLWGYLAAEMRGKEFGDNFLRHGGMWGDFFIVSPILGLIAQKLATEWSGPEWMAALAISTIVSGFMAWMWAQDPAPTAHTVGGHQTLTGWIHLVYMIPVLAAIGLVYFCPPATMSPKFIIATSTALMIHMILGTHMVLGMLIKLKILDPDQNNKQYLRDPVAWSTLVVVAAALTWRTWVIVGRQSV